MKWVIHLSVFLDIRATTPDTISTRAGGKYKYFKLYICIWIFSFVMFIFILFAVTITIQIVSIRAFWIPAGPGFFAYTHKKAYCIFFNHAFKSKEGIICRTNLAEWFKIEYFWVGKNKIWPICLNNFWGVFI